MGGVGAGGVGLEGALTRVATSHPGIRGMYMQAAAAAAAEAEATGPETAAGSGAAREGAVVVVVGAAAKTPLESWEYPACCPASLAAGG